MAFDTVRVTTEKALALAERVSRHNAERLTPKEMKILIERIAWEVVPSIATELIQAELTRHRSQHVKS
jgi:hypothetical protein